MSLLLKRKNIMSVSENTVSKKKRPLSPHLQIYKPQTTSALSILHRITGVGLVFGLVAVVAWLWVLAFEPSSYEMFVGALNSIVGKIFLIGLAGAISYHICTGIRHLFLDMGYGYDKEDAKKTSLLIIVSSVVLTAIVVALGFGYI